MGNGDCNWTEHADRDRIMQALNGCKNFVEPQQKHNCKSIRSFIMMKKLDVTEFSKCGWWNKNRVPEYL